MTKIHWTNATWNPIIGCSKVSEGCQNCYAEKMANRLSFNPLLEDNVHGEGYSHVISNGHWNGKTFFNKRLIEKPFKWKKPRMIFVCSMADLFHESVPFEWVDQVINVIRWTKQHTYQILTKRPARMAEYFREHVPEEYTMENGDMLDNLWLGVTAENQKRANERIPILLQIPAAKRFVSIEPMLGEIDLEIDVDPLKWGGYTKRNLLTGELRNQHRGSACATPTNNHLDWVICGAESGNKRRPMDFDWAINIQQQCEESNVPFFFKQRYIDDKKVSLPMIYGKVYNQIPERGR